MSLKARSRARRWSRAIFSSRRAATDDLAALKMLLDCQERRFDSLEAKVAGIDGKLDGLIKSLPSIIAEVMREVLREGDGLR